MEGTLPEVDPGTSLVVERTVDLGTPSTLLPVKVRRPLVDSTASVLVSWVSLFAHWAWDRSSKDLEGNMLVERSAEGSWRIQLRDM